MVDNKAGRLTEETAKRIVGKARLAAEKELRRLGISPENQGKRCFREGEWRLEEAGSACWEDMSNSWASMEIFLHSLSEAITVNNRDAVNQLVSHAKSLATMPTRIPSRSTGELVQEIADGYRKDSLPEGINLFTKDRRSDGWDYLSANSAIKTTAKSAAARVMLQELEILGIINPNDKDKTR